MTRLPVPGSDNGTWGILLNDFLDQSHATDGTLKANSVSRSALQAGAVTAADVGLGNVTNTADAAKPISTATQAALNTKVGSSTSTIGDAIVMTAANYAALSVKDAKTLYVIVG